MKLSRRIIASVVALVTFVSGAATLAPSASAFNKDDWRVFIVCDFSHSAKNDPIMHPGMKGMSHLHDFFGNKRTSDKASYKYMTEPLARTSCDTHHDRSAYWAPAIRNVNTGRIRHATHIQVYIQNRTKTPGMVPWPKGFKAVSTETLMLPPKAPFDWNGAGIRVLFTDEQCWSGVKPTSGPWPTVAMDGNKCPADYPILLPHLHYNVRYGIMSMKNWEPISMPEMSYHGDFWNTWEQPWLSAVVDACLTLPALADGKGCGRITDDNIKSVLKARGVKPPKG